MPHHFQFTSTDGLRIACARWDSRGPVRGIVQIAHGLGEHIGRYVRLVEHLVQAGLVVYGNDHRGHGRTALSPEHFGDFGPGLSSCSDTVWAPSPRSSSCSITLRVSMAWPYPGPGDADD